MSGDWLFLRSPRSKKCLSPSESVAVILSDMTQLRLAAAALNQTPLAWDDNRRNILAAIGAAREAEVGVLCLPELCISGYGCEDQFFSAGLHETSLEILSEIIPHCKSLAVSLGLALPFDDVVFNAVALVCNAEKCARNTGVMVPH